MRPAPPASDANVLQRGSLGMWSIVFLVISAASPLSVLAGGFPIGMLLGNGAGMPALVILTLFILLIFSAGYTAMARYESSACGFYSFTARGLGGRAGAAAGMLALCAYSVLQIGLYGIFGAVVSGNVEALFAYSVPWWVYSIMAMSSITVLGYRSVGLSAWLLTAIVVCEYAAILILDACIIFAGGADGLNLDAFRPSQVTGGVPSIGLLFCFAAFIGFESTTIYAEEAREPRRSVPRATYLSVLLIGSFYALSTWALVMGVGTEKLRPLLGALQDPTTLIYGVSDHFAGPWLTRAIRVLFMSSIYAGLLAFHNSTARYLYCIGRDGLLPARLGRTHEEYGSPYIASAVQTVIAAAVVLACAAFDVDPLLQLFTVLSNVATLCIIFLMMLTSLATYRYFGEAAMPGASIWTTRIFPALSVVLLVPVLVLAMLHFEVLGHTGKLGSYLSWLVVPLALAVGVLLAMRLRRHSPNRYLHLGRHRG